MSQTSEKIQARVQEYCQDWPVTATRLKFSRRQRGRIITVERPDPISQRVAEEELLALVMELLHQRYEAEYEQER